MWQLIRLDKYHDFHYSDGYVVETLTSPFHDYLDNTIYFFQMDEEIPNLGNYKLLCAKLIEQL